ncbi:MAG TPA: hypothetical protein VIT67_07585, partial [Povalibacter sp.]
GAPSRSSYAGAVYVFARSGSNWAQSTTLTPSTPVLSSNFGNDIALAGSAAAPVLVVGAPYEDVVVGSPPSTLDSSGAAYVFTLSGATWTAARLGNPSPGSYDYFGTQVALSADGAYLAVSSPNDAIEPTDPSQPITYGVGAAHVYSRSGSSWQLPTTLRAQSLFAYTSFGNALVLSADGNTLVAGAPYDDGNARGVEGVADTQSQNPGAAHVFTRSSGTWSAGRYIKASNAESYQYFGNAVAVSNDGGTVTVGAEYEATASDNVNGNQLSDCAAATSTNCAYAAGAVYVY